MMRLPCFVLILVAFPASATDIYRWTDADGVVHYTDQATPGAERIRIESSPTYKGIPPPAAATTKAKPAPKAPGRYDVVEITSPSQQETLWNVAGQVPVTIRIQPDVRPGDTVRLSLDNAPVEGPSPDATQFQLSDVYRGVHTLRADVLDTSGKIIASSSPVTFVVRQTSVLNNPSPR